MLNVIAAQAIRPIPIRTLSSGLWIGKMKDERKCENPLIALLTVRMATDGLSVTVLGERLGVSQGYMSQLLREDRPVAAASEVFIRECAKYLGMPAVTCFLLAGKLIGADFYKPLIPFEQLLNLALMSVADSHLAKDAAVSYEQLLELPGPVRHLLVLLHEVAFTVDLIKEKASRAELAAACEFHQPFSVTKVRHR